MAASDFLYEQRLSFLCWNPGPRRRSPGAIEVHFAGPWHTLALQELVEFFQHEVVTRMCQVAAPKSIVKIGSSDHRIKQVTSKRRSTMRVLHLFSATVNEETIIPDQASRPPSSENGHVYSSVSLATLVFRQLPLLLFLFHSCRLSPRLSTSPCFRSAKKASSGPDHAPGAYVGVHRGTEELLAPQSMVPRTMDQIVVVLVSQLV